MFARDTNLFRHFIKLLASSMLLLGFCLPASAGYLYSLDARGTNVGDFDLLVPSLITTTTTFQFSDFASINPPPNTTSVRFDDPLSGGPQIWFSNIGYFWLSPFNAPGQYCSGFVACNASDAILTISVSNVPEPESMALVGLGLIGLLCSRRKKV